MYLSLSYLLQLSFSQHERKETLTLSIASAIEPYDNYTKINTLQLQNEQRDEFTTK
jgi:hypothetical protein